MYCFAELARLSIFVSNLPSRKVTFELNIMIKKGLNRNLSHLHVVAGGILQFSD